MQIFYLSIQAVFLFFIAASAANTLPSLYICRHIILEPDTAVSPAVVKVIQDSTHKYFTSLFTIDKSSVPDEVRLIDHHRNYVEGKKVSLAAEAFCPAAYILCINARSTVRFGTEDIDITIPAMIPGGGIAISKLHFTDETSEYHYETEIRFTIYRSADGRRILSWTDKASSQEDTARCNECIEETIGEISENTYRNASAKNPFVLFLSASAGMFLPLGWHSNDIFSLGSNFGGALKFTIGKIAGIDIQYAHFSTERRHIEFDDLYIGPCFGYKIPRLSPYLSFLYPNLSYGISTLWNHTRQTDTSTTQPRIQVSTAFSAKAAVLLAFNGIPLAIEPNIRMLIERGLAFSPGIRIGYLYERKKIR